MAGIQAEPGVQGVKSSFKPLKYLGLAVLIFIAWHLHPKLSHICREKICPPVFAAAKEGICWADKREFVECPSVATDFRLSWLIKPEERSEELKELFKLTLCQARAPPQMINGTQIYAKNA